MTVYTHQTPAYGQWRAVALAVDGSEHEGWGLSQQAAEYRARLKAKQATCEGCGAPISEGTALVSRRSHGRALCEPCRMPGTDDVDFNNENEQ